MRYLRYLCLLTAAIVLMPPVDAGLFGLSSRRRCKKTTTRVVVMRCASNVCSRNVVMVNGRVVIPKTIAATSPAVSKMPKVVGTAPPKVVDTAPPKVVGTASPNAPPSKIAAIAPMEPGKSSVKIIEPATLSKSGWNKTGQPDGVLDDFTLVK